jgi:hypothetical protein
VLVIENVLPDHEPNPRGHTLDIIMLAVTGGRERTPSQLTALFDQAGLDEPTIIKTDGPLQIAAAQALQPSGPRNLAETLDEPAPAGPSEAGPHGDVTDRDLNREGPR